MIQTDDIEIIQEVEQEQCITAFEPLPGKDGKLSKQELALSIDCDIILLGGAAGGTKTFTILGDELRNIDLPAYRSLILRKTRPQITKPGALLDDSRKIFFKVGAKLNKSDLYWTFPSGAVVGFGGCETEADIENYMGTRVPVIKFDQLEQFKAREFWDILGRLSSVSCPEIKPYCMASFNPPDDDEHWLLPIIEWWLDEKKTYADPAKIGIIRWFVRNEKDDNLSWFETEEEAWEHIKANYSDALRDKVKPKSLTFIAATVEDNTVLMDNDPDYIAQLAALPLVERERKLKGNFSIGYTAGNIFRDEWWKIAYNLPRNDKIIQVVRAWDRAATEILKKALKKKIDPDFTASALMLRSIDNLIYIVNIQEFRGTPGKVLEEMKSTARVDFEEFGYRYSIAIPQDPGSAGVYEADDTAAELSGFDVHFYINSGSKITRALPFSAQCERGNVVLIHEDWNNRLKQQAKKFPTPGFHDDIIDAVSLGFKVLTEDNTNAMAGY